MRIDRSEYGYWIDPRGNVTPVSRYEEHEGALKHSDGMVHALAVGWVRVSVSDFDHRIWCDFDLPLTPARRQALFWICDEHGYQPYDERTERLIEGVRRASVRERQIGESPNEFANLLQQDDDQALKYLTKLCGHADRPGQLREILREVGLSVEEDRFTEASVDPSEYERAKAAALRWLDRNKQYANTRAYQERKLDIEHTIEVMEQEMGVVHEFVNFYVLPRGSRVWVMAHHDVVIKEAHNANDNTASVVNAILYRLDHPQVGVALTDGEEPPHLGAGARQFAKRFGSSKPRVINLELTGKGGWGAAGVSGDRSEVQKHFLGKGVNQHLVPFSDATILHDAGIDCTCIFTCTDPNTKKMHHGLMSNMHSHRDHLSTVSTSDMADFRSNLKPHVQELIDQDRGQDLPTE